MRVIVCGGRDYTNETEVYRILDAVHSHRSITHLIHGGARGADLLADKWARAHSVPIITCIEADWKTHGRRAGWVRNNEMADLEPDLVIAFPGGKGTAMMKGIATERGIDLVDIEE